MEGVSGGDDERQRKCTHHHHTKNEGRSPRKSGLLNFEFVPLFTYFVGFRVFVDKQSGV
jgi:hypothetical protein